MRRLGAGVSVKLLLTFVIGSASFALLIYFYLAQRNFAYQYEEIRAEFSGIEKSHRNLNYEILRTALFAYANQDVITEEMAALKKTYALLRKHPVWKGKQYREARGELESLGGVLRDFEQTVDDFLMLNAGIKNSFVYITSLTAKKAAFFEGDPHVYTEILSIIARVSQARVLSDASFLEGIRPRVEHLAEADNLTDRARRVLKDFLLHVRFIERNYPHFIAVINRIESSPLGWEIRAAEAAFNRAARTDFVMLDRFAAVLLALFMLAMILIVWLLVRTDRENRRLRQLEAELRYTLSHDQLTGLLSRNRFETLQERFVSPTLLLLNIDHFKHINDFYGIQAGNRILKEVAVLIRQPMFKPYDPLYFRLGGDDFGVVLSRVGAERVRQLGSLLKYSIESHAFSIDGIETYITVSVAANCTLPLLENADLALKYEKTKHTEGVTFFSDVMHLKEQAKNNLQVTRRVKSALDRQAIVPWFQPVVSLHTGEVVKYEALVRLINEDGSVDSPGAFLPAAMQTPYYRRITETMLRQVMEVMRESRYRFSINLSMRDLADEKMVSMLMAQLERNRETAGRLDIELLESEELDDLQSVRDFIGRVKAYGCKIAIDDFGSGYSNFAYIIDLPVDILKIDGSLIRRMRSDSHKFRAVETIAEFARTLGLEVTAEYVEDAETAQMLREMGIALGQGYYFGRPAAGIGENGRDGP